LKLKEAADLIDHAVAACIRKKQGLTVDIGGHGSTTSTGDGIVREIEHTKI
jgi:isocitrate/isopropylmalate dehydrogenase